MKPKHYYDKVWRCNFYFYPKWRPEDFISYLNKEVKYDRDLTEGVGGRMVEVCGDNGYVGYHIWVRKDKTPVFISQLAHECVHAAAYCLEKRGWKYQADNNEPLTYLVERLMIEALSGGEL